MIVKAHAMDPNGPLQILVKVWRDEGTEKYLTACRAWIASYGRLLNDLDWVTNCIALSIMPGRLVALRIKF